MKDQYVIIDIRNMDFFKDENILWCLKECDNENNLKDYPLETILKSKEALLKILELNFIERYFVYYEYENYKKYL